MDDQRPAGKRLIKLPVIGMRTLLIIVGVFGLSFGWISYQFYWIHERHKFFNSEHNRSFVFGPPTEHDMPLTARLIGERPVLLINVHDADNAEAKRLFPEARVLVVAN